jgi:hypothetical protein
MFCVVDPTGDDDYNKFKLLAFEEERMDRSRSTSSRWRTGWPRAASSVI